MQAQSGNIQARGGEWGSGKLRGGWGRPGEVKGGEWRLVETRGGAGTEATSQASEEAVQTTGGDSLK